jgi:opacity protein-like surface antigen
MKKVLAVLAILVFLSGSAFAGAVQTNTTLRSQAGDNGGVPVWHLMTLGNVCVLNTLPSRINDMAGNVGIEVNSSGLAFGYMAFDIGSGILGITVNPNPDYLSLASANVTKPDNVLGAIYGLDLGGGTNLGLGINFGWDSDTRLATDDETTPSFGDDDIKNSEMLIGILAGATMDLTSLMLDLGLNVRIAMDSDVYIDKDNADQSVTEDHDTDDGMGLGIGVAARAVIDSWLVALGVQYDSANSKNTDKNDSDNDGTWDSDMEYEWTDSGMAVALQAGHILKASESLKITIATALNFTSSKTTMSKTVNNITSTTTYGPTDVYSNSNISIPVWIAVEGTLNKTWQIFGGAGYTVLNLASQTYEYNEDTSAETLTKYTDQSDLNVEPSLSYALGVRGVIGDLTIDFMLDPSVLILGPYLLTGNGTASGNMAAQIALNYPIGG